MIRSLLIACLMWGALAVGGETVALVNGDPISREELDRATGLAEIVLSLSQQFPSFAQALLLTEEGKAFVARYEHDVLEKLIVRLIQLQEARRRGLAADEAEVEARTEAALRAVYAYYGIGEEEFTARLLAQGYSLDEYRADIARDYRERLLIAALRATLRAEIEIRDEDIRAYYDEDPGRFVDDEGGALDLDEVYERIAALLRLERDEAHWQAWLFQARAAAEVEITR